MKGKSGLGRSIAWGAAVGSLLALAAFAPGLALALAWPLALYLMRNNLERWGGRTISARRPYRPRDTGAGRWLDAPAAELDKSTVGKLLASRASRDPGLHVVPPSPAPACVDALYDPEIDGQ